MKNFIISDTHFSHKTSLKWLSRKHFNSQFDISPDLINKEILYKDTMNMNETIISNWNEVVSKNDLVYHLGDLSFDKPMNTKNILSKLNGNIILIKGNHDKWKDIKIFKDRFIDIVDYKEIKYQYLNKNYHICMMHFPISSWNRKHYNSIMLHGHSHGNIIHDITENNIIYDVGVDTKLSNLYPIEIDYILEDVRKLF